MADNLESYFKKKLSDDSPGEGEWNVPSDDVFNSVLPEIQEKKGIFIPWKYLYLISLIIVVALMVFLWTNDDFRNSGNQEMVQSEDAPQSSTPLSEKFGGENESTESFTNKNATNDLSQSSSENTITTESTAGITTPPSTTTKSGGGDITIAENAHKETIFGEQNTDKAISESKSADIETSDASQKMYAESVPTNSIVELSKLTIPTIASDITPTLEKQKPLDSTDAEEDIANKKEPFLNKGKFGLGFYFEPTFTSTYLTGDLNDGKLETSNMYLYSSNWGFEVKYFISNRFSLVTGIGKSEIRSWSKSLIDFDYDSSNEQTMPGGEKENTSAVPMQTPFGEIDTEITYRFPGDAEIPEGDVMYSAMETHQDIRYLSIPLGVEFNIIRFSRFDWLADAGVRYNRALKDATEFSSRVIHHGHDMDIVSEEMTSHPTFTENYLSFYVGTGLSYQFSKNFQLNTSVKYFGSLTEVNLQDNMSTYVHGFNIKVGIIYIF